MFHENELLSEYGRACRKRAEFWKIVGIPKRNRNKFVKVFGMTCSEFAETYQYCSREDIMHDYNVRVEEKVEKMASFDCISNLSLSDFCLAKEALVKAQVPNPYWVWTGFDYQLTSNKEEENMDSTYEQRRYLESRLYDEHNKKSTELAKFFHVQRHTPNSPREAIELIAAGKVKWPTIEELEKNGFDPDGNYYDGIIFDFIDWDMEPADKDGFKAANALQCKAYTDAKDVIKVSDPKDGLAALKEFESKTFH